MTPSSPASSPHRPFTIATIMSQSAVSALSERLPAATFDVVAVTEDDVNEWVTEPDAHDVIRPNAVLLPWNIANVLSFMRLEPACRQLRIPFFAVCSGSSAERVAAVMVGAHDALDAPVDPVILEAKLHAFSRLSLLDSGLPGDGLDRPAPAHAVPPEEESSDNDSLSHGALTIDLAARRFFAREIEIRLTPIEFKLVAFLMRSPGVCLTRDTLLSSIWGIDFDPGTNTLDVHVYGVRCKLREHQLDGAIETVRGVGFRLIDPS